jgi:hypothetical protein
MLASPVTLRREGAGQYIGGIWTPGAVAGSTIQAVVTDVKGQDAENLPDGISVDRSKIIWTKHELRPASESDQAVGDIIVWQGVSYRIFRVQDRQEGGFYRAVMEMIHDNG